MKNILNLEMIDREIQYFDDPFRYAVIDNFFSEKDLEFVTAKLDFLEQNRKFRNDTEQRKKNVKKQLHNYEKTPDERYAKYFQLINSLDIKQDKEKDYTSEYAYFYRARKEVEDNPVHTENIYRAISLTVYMGKEKNYGTLLYDENKNFVKEIEWKYNRAFVMAGFNNQKGKLPGISTWHTYKTKPDTIRKTFFGYTVSGKESILNHSLYKEYKNFWLIKNMVS